MIEIKGISKSYPSGRGIVKAICDISFCVPLGTTLAIAGKSGSGKTTLLNCIGGLEFPNCGSINCFGIDIHTLKKNNCLYFSAKIWGLCFSLVIFYHF